MHWLTERVSTALAVSLLVLTVAASDPSALAFAGIVAIAVTAVVGVRYAAILLRAGELCVGHRARGHRELLHTAPAPAHPGTPGRTRARAPARLLAAA